MTNKKPSARIRHIDPRKLVLDERYQGRQPELNNSRQDQAAIKRSREMQIERIVSDLCAGKGIRNTIIAFELDGKLFVVDGFHRTKACVAYLKENPGAELKVPVKVYKQYNEAQAYFASLCANQNHGTALSASERIQNQFKRDLISDKYKELPSKTKAADDFSCSPTNGLHIRRALVACQGVSSISADDWRCNVHEAAERLQNALMTDYPNLRFEDFDKDGFPIIRRLSDAVTAKNKMVKFEDESPEVIERKAVSSLARKLEGLIASEGGERFRDALKRLDRNALGISVKREWDEDKVLLTYPYAESEPF